MLLLCFNKNHTPDNTQTHTQIIVFREVKIDTTSYMIIHLRRSTTKVLLLIDGISV